HVDCAGETSTARALTDKNDVARFGDNLDSGIGSAVVLRWPFCAANFNNWPPTVGSPIAPHAGYRYKFWLFGCCFDVAEDFPGSLTAYAYRCWYCLHAPAA